MLPFSDFIAQGCGDADMCEVTDTCAEIELNNLVLKNNAHPCAMTPVCTILSKTKRRYGFNSMFARLGTDYEIRNQ